MATNDFSLFGCGAGANVTSQAGYIALAGRTSGFQSGTASSADCNKVWRQASIIASMIGQFIADKSGQSALDDGTTATLLTNFEAGITQMVAAGQSGVGSFNTRTGAVVLNSTDVTTALGWTPVQQGTGVGQTTNVIKIGWSGASKPKLTVDTTDQGNIALEPWVTANYWTAAYIGANFRTLASSDSIYATYSWVTSNFQPKLSYTPANKAGDTFTGSMQFNSNMVIGTGSSASPIGDQVNGCGWNATTFQSMGVGAHFQIGMQNGTGTGDFLEFFWKTGALSNTLVGSISLSGGGSGIAFNTTSDYRLKNVIGSVASALDRINAVPVHRIAYKADASKQLLDSFFAHEVQAQIPEAVTGVKDAMRDDGTPAYQTVDYARLEPVMWKAIQEISAQVTVLNGKVSAPASVPTLAVVCTSIPALNGTYPIDAATQTQITSIAAAINAGMGLPGGGTTFDWRDSAGISHPWPGPQFTDFAKAVMNYVYALGQVSHGVTTTQPTQPVVIA